MRKQVAVILSGCGSLDGSEIYETTLTLLRLNQLGIGYRCFAPDMEQRQVISPLMDTSVSEPARNVLVESARLARGNIDALDALDPEAFDGVILPGGLGAAKNLSDFSEAGADMSVLPLLRDKVIPFGEAGKPIGLMGIAAVLVPHLLGEGVSVTVGRDAGICGAISSMGGLHKSCDVDGVVVDREHCVVTTPAYMLAEQLSEAALGIFKLVDKLDEMME